MNLRLLYFCDSVVNSWRDNGFLCADLSVGDILCKSEANAAARACLNEIVLRTCIECIHSVHEFGVEDNVSLLWGL